MTPKIITSEVGFLMMTSSQLLVTVVFVIMVILDTDHERIDFRTQCFITFSHGIMTPLVMATFAVMEHRSKEEDIKQVNLQSFMNEIRLIFIIISSLVEDCKGG